MDIKNVNGTVRAAGTRQAEVGIEGGRIVAPGVLERERRPAVAGGFPVLLA